MTFQFSDFIIVKLRKSRSNQKFLKYCWAVVVMKRWPMNFQAQTRTLIHHPECSVWWVIWWSTVGNGTVVLHDFCGQGKMIHNNWCLFAWNNHVQHHWTHLCAIVMLNCQNTVFWYMSCIMKVPQCDIHMWSSLVEIQLWDLTGRENFGFKP